MKGYGYRDWEQTVEVQEGRTTAIRIEMEQLAPLEEKDWYSGDLHVHSRLTSPAMLRGEDLNLVAHTLYCHQSPVDLTKIIDRVDKAHIECADQEIEDTFFGNVFYFNVPTSVQDAPGNVHKMTPLFHFDEQCHAAGGISLRWFRYRPFDFKGAVPGQRQFELAVSAANGHMDVWSILDNNAQDLLDKAQSRWRGDGWELGRSSVNQIYAHTYESWYRLLNCGLRITASAGTSYGRRSRPGFNRVYVHIQGDLSVQSFADGLKRGDGFVTNGPLLWLRTNGRRAGDAIDLTGPGNVEIEVELVSRYPLEMVEILKNGAVVWQKNPEGLPGRVQWKVPLEVDEPSWFAARCFGRHEPRYRHSGAHNQFAHTNAQFVTIQGEKPRSAKDAAGFLKEVDALAAFLETLPPGDLTEEMRLRSRHEYERARAFYQAMAAK
jgi:hypothetical protein